MKPKCRPRIPPRLVGARVRPRVAALFSVASIAVGFGAVAASGCSSVDSSTQITLALSSEAEVPSELDSFTVRVTSTQTGELRFSQDYFPTSGRDFPTTLAVIPFDESSLSSPLDITLLGRKGDVVLLQRDSVISYAQGRNLLLDLPLRMSCFQSQDCGAGSTCVGGTCASSTVDSASLVDYSASYVFGDAGTCFDEQACLTGGSTLTINKDCTFDLPSGTPAATGNVAVEWAAAPGRRIALESSNLAEGWVRTTSGQGQLSQGVCDAYFRTLGADGAPLVTDAAKSVVFAASCPSKTALVPYCFSNATGQAGVGAVDP